MSGLCDCPAQINHLSLASRLRAMASRLNVEGGFPLRRKYGFRERPLYVLLVGIDVELALFGHLINPSGKDGVIQTMVAAIDESTASLPRDYCFTADFVGRSKTDAVVIPLRSCNAENQVSIPGLNTIDWQRPVGLIYGSPDDRRIARTKVSGHP
jgi:hypothetical protein